MAGTVTLALLLDTATPAPPNGAGAVNVIVQLDDPGAATVPGEQVNDEGVTATIRVTVVECCWPLNVAVTVAVCALLTVPVVAANVPLLCPAAIVTRSGFDGFAAGGAARHIRQLSDTLGGIS